MIDVIIILFFKLSLDQEYLNLSILQIKYCENTLKLLIHEAKVTNFTNICFLLIQNLWILIDYIFLYCFTLIFIIKINIKTL